MGTCASRLLSPSCGEHSVRRIRRDVARSDSGSDEFERFGRREVAEDGASASKATVLGRGAGGRTGGVAAATGEAAVMTGTIS